MLKKIYKAKPLTSALLFFILGGTAFSADTPPAPPKPMVTVGKVTETSETVKRSLIGVIISPSVVNVTSRISAEIEKVGFDEGSFVKEDQLLYQLDPIKYDAAVKSTEAKIAEIKARIAYAQSSYNRKETLYSKKINSKETIDSAMSKLNAYQAELKAQEAELISVKDDLKNTRITAPISGRIGITNFTRGNYITPASGTLATIVQLDPIRVRFTISNRDFLSLFQNEGELKEEAKIRLIRANGSEYKFTGKIEFINNRANHNTDTLQIFASFKNPDNELIPGSIVTVELIKSEDIKTPAITPSAVMHDNNGAYIYVVTNGSKIERRSVVLGSSTENLQLIEKGVKPGEEIVTDGMHKVMPGSEIIPDYSAN